ncbi:Protein of unknown function [Cotesia congregata]|uniref:Uncharacterized protein n=1 Tax=Cotesia congregata TaxID=51543 RepID=A0A8J2H7H8_COTCN|nr:Protein of unknown function [Cotesia congregata]
MYEDIQELASGKLRADETLKRGILLANHTECKSQGGAPFIIQIASVAGEQYLSVLNDLSHPIVLGMDFALQFGVIIDSKTRTWRFSGSPEFYPFELVSCKERSSDCAEITSEQDQDSQEFLRGENPENFPDWRIVDDRLNYHRPDPLKSIVRDDTAWKLVLKDSESELGDLDLDQDEWKQRVSRLDELRHKIENKMQRESERQARYYNQDRSIPEVQVGDKVFYPNRKLSSKAQGYSASLGNKYLGPATISRVVSPLVVELMERQGRRSRGVGRAEMMRRCASRREVPRFGRAYGVARRATRAQSGSFQIGILSEPPAGRVRAPSRSAFDRLGPVISPSRSSAPGMTEQSGGRLPFRDLAITLHVDSEQAAGLPDPRPSVQLACPGLIATEAPEINKNSPPATLESTVEPVAEAPKRRTKEQKRRQYRKQKLRELLDRPDASPERLKNLCRHLTGSSTAARRYLSGNQPSHFHPENSTTEELRPEKRQLEVLESVPEIADQQEEARGLPILPEAEYSPPRPRVEGLAEANVQGVRPEVSGNQVQQVQKKKRKNRRKNKERGPD